MQENRNLPKSG